VSGKTVEVAGRPLRVRPYPLDLLPRLLRVQVELAQVFAGHLSAILAAARIGSSAGWQALQRSLGGPLAVRAQAPYLGSAERLPALVHSGLCVEVSRSTPGAPRALLAIDIALCRALGIRDATRLAELMQGALSGSGAQCVAIGGSALDALLADSTLRTPLVVDAQLRVGEEAGWGRLVTSSALRVAAAPGASVSGAFRDPAVARERLSGVSTDLVIEAGYGFLPSREVLGFSVGDIVMLDHFGPRPITGGPVWLRLGRGVFPGHLDGAGVTVLGSYYLRAHDMADPQTESAAPSPETESLSDSLLRELPVQVTCEIGRVTLSAREILDLRPGTVLPVGRPLAGPVDLTAGGRVLAHGELVDVEGEIGVRITEILS